MVLLSFIGIAAAVGLGVASSDQIFSWAEILVLVGASVATFTAISGDTYIVSVKQQTPDSQKNLKFWSILLWRSGKRNPVTSLVVLIGLILACAYGVGEGWLIKKGL